jgi:enterobactin synthetase component D
MPSPSSSNKFLAPSKQVVTGIDQTVLLHAPFDLAYFSETSFVDHGIELPTSLKTAVIKRKSDFLAGRALVSRAFDELGLLNQNIAVGPKRSPIWPKGMNGSISHTGQHCACIATTQPNTAVGIDIEQMLKPNGLKSVRRIAMTTNDTDVVASHSLFSTQHLCTLIFSAKETLYKALFPTVQAFFGFDAATLHCDPTENTIWLRLTRSLHPSLQKNQVFALRHQQLDDKILTWLIYREKASIDE